MTNSLTYLVLDDGIIVTELLWGLYQCLEEVDELLVT